MRAWRCDELGPTNEITGKKECKKGGTISSYVSHISAVHTQFGAQSPTKLERVKILIKKWADDDGQVSSEGLCMETDLPRLYEKNWSMRGWSMSYRCCNWSQLLTSLMFFCRVSCTTDFCPLAEHTRLAPAEAWDVDGFPKFISLGWLDWKKRTKLNRNKVEKIYYMRLWRNYVEPKYCPMLWLLRWLSVSGIKKGPIYQRLEGKPEAARGKKRSVRSWSENLQRLFIEIGDCQWFAAASSS